MEVFAGWKQFCRRGSTCNRSYEIQGPLLLGIYGRIVLETRPELALTLDDFTVSAGKHSSCMFSTRLPQPKQTILSVDVNEQLTTVSFASRGHPYEGLVLVIQLSESPPTCPPSVRASVSTPAQTYTRDKVHRARRPPVFLFSRVLRSLSSSSSFFSHLTLSSFVLSLTVCVPSPIGPFPSHRESRL